MRVLLIKPYNLSDHIQPSLGLGYLATALRHRHDVRIIDCIKDNIRLDTLSEHIRDFNPDILGMQCYTFHLDFVRKSFAAAKKINPKVINIAGGPHPSAVPAETLASLGALVDFVFQGEAEIGFPLLLDKIEKGADAAGLKEVPGLAWSENGTVNLNKQVYPDNLDALGLPAWDLIHPETYPEAQHGAFFKNFPIAPIMITRGCPYSCTFCAGGLISGKKIRKRSIGHVIKELRMLYDDYGIREFQIIDDNFTVDKKYAKELLAKIIELNLDISLATPNGVRVDALDEELLGLFKRAGLYIISLGIESGSDRVLQLMKKDLTVSKVHKVVDLIRSFDIDIAGFFIMGLPQETILDMKKTVELSLKLDLIRANFFTYLPFPGTESYRSLEKSGELNKVDWEKFYFMSAPYVPAGLTRKKLKDLQRMAFLRFYLRPRVLVKNILSIKSPRHLHFLLKRFFHWLILK